MVRRGVHMARASVDWSTTSHRCVPASTSVWPSVERVAGVGVSTAPTSSPTGAVALNDILSECERERGGYGVTPANV